MKPRFVKQSVSFISFTEDGKVLAIARRHDENDFGLVGGKVEPGETLVEAVIRETREESGIQLSHAPQPIYTALAQGISGTMYLTTTFIDSNADYTQCGQQPNEGKLAFIPPQLLLFGTFAPYNRALLENMNCVTNKLISIEADAREYLHQIVPIQQYTPSNVW